jgi:hypothetical protein
MTMHAASIKVNLEQLAICAAVAIADSPFVELEFQCGNLASMAACRVITQQQAADVAFTAARAAFGPGMVERHGAAAISGGGVVYTLPEEEQAGS